MPSGSGEQEEDEEGGEERDDQIASRYMRQAVEGMAAHGCFDRYDRDGATAARVLAALGHVEGDARASYLYRVWALPSRLPRDVRTFSLRPT